MLHEKLTRMNIVLQQELEELNDQSVDIYVGHHRVYVYCSAL